LRTCTPRASTGRTSRRPLRCAPSTKHPKTGADRDVEAGTFSKAQTVTVTVNGTTYERAVEARKLLIHFIRDDLDLTGSHIGCDTGNCGACSMIVNGTLVKSCMMLAVQADGTSIETVEGLGDGDELNALQ